VDLNRHELPKEGKNTPERRRRSSCRSRYFFRAILSGDLDRYEFLLL
jgi:hypothetical protein